MANEELRWDDPIENDGEGGFVLLPEGEYPFQVMEFERKRFAGSAKMGPCPQAVLKLRVGSEETGTTVVQENLYLHKKSEWKLCEFFRSIGARTHGERMVMDWSKVPGATGRCKVFVDTWEGRDGKPKESNKIANFLDPADHAVAASQQGDSLADIPF